MKILSWNVNGIRAAVKKNFVASVKKIDPDLICLQETKAQSEEVEEALKQLSEYRIYTNSAERKGYSGTALLCKQAPSAITYGIGKKIHDSEGRVISAEFPDFCLITAYVPNSGRGQVRLDYRQRWDKAFLSYLKKTEQRKPVVLCGDLNVAHQPIDLARPKSNYNKTSGYTQVEIDGFSAFLKKGFIDTFRQLYPDEIKYSWWSYMFNARKKNVGWRIDYFLVSKGLMSRVKDSQILTEIEGSDHCPILLQLSES